MPKITILPDNKGWRGYSFDELRYRRARVAANLQVQKVMLASDAGNLRRGNPVTRSWNTMRDIFSAIGYVNSALLAVQLFRRFRGLWRTFRN